MLHRAVWLFRVRVVGAPPVNRLPIGPWRCRLPLGCPGAMAVFFEAFWTVLVD